MTIAEEIRKRLLERWAHLQPKIFSDGLVLIGKLNNNPADYGYLHYIFPPASQNDIRRIEVELRSPLPVDLRQFYLECRGLSLYNKLLNLSGIRTAGRSGDVEQLLRQPSDVVGANAMLRARGHGPVNIHTYEDLSRVGIVSNGALERRSESGVLMNQWSDFRSWIVGEIDRFDQFFSKDGHLLVEPMATPPSPTLSQNS